MTQNAEVIQDVMQVCRNGHVITDRLHGDPDGPRFHCERCGAVTLHECPTCGAELPGAGLGSSLVPVGLPPAPTHCETCGAAFPWVRNPRRLLGPMERLGNFLRRLPLVIRQLRWRQGSSPPYCVDDDRDLEDLLRSLLPLYFDDIRLESRTPSYSPATRTDLLLAAEKIAITVKFVKPEVSERQLVAQFQEDVEYHMKRPACHRLVGYFYDPFTSIRVPAIFEGMICGCQEGLEIFAIVAN